MVPFPSKTEGASQGLRNEAGTGTRTIVGVQIVELFPGASSPNRE